jgi:hypothetical protein
MDVVVRWKKTYIPHTVFENVKTFDEASILVDNASIEMGAPTLISVVENNKVIASLRVIK